MLLQYLLEEIEVKKLVGSANVIINKVEYHSKKIEQNDLFVAMKGFHENGEQYIEEAIEKGANSIVCDATISLVEKAGINYIYVDNTREALAKIASKYYDDSHKKLKLIGITGTKGKTTTAYMIRNILLAAGIKVGMIGTIETTYAGKSIPSDHTSPESLELHKIFKDMVENEIEFAVMEVSSHALELSRVYGLSFMISVFTNLSEEHLDFHETMENYLVAKAKLFGMSSFALINGDDKYSAALCKMISCKIAKYGLDNEVNLTAADIKVNNSYTEFKMFINKALETIAIPIPGRFNVYNALAAIGVASMINCQIDSVIKGLSVTKVPGRNEVVDIGKTFTAIVDYAHNPSSLEAILVNTKKYTKGRIICVFGCGGNRDTEKRSLMGEIAGRYANFTVITTDNPRDEKPQDIANEIIEGMKRTNGLYKYIENRKEAIRFAMKISWKNDIIIVAGKGHEDYQISENGKKIPFDDREIIKRIASEMKDKNIEQ